MQQRDEAQLGATAVVSPEAPEKEIELLQMDPKPASLATQQLSPEPKSRPTELPTSGPDSLATELIDPKPDPPPSEQRIAESPAQITVALDPGSSEQQPRSAPRRLSTLRTNFKDFRFTALGHWLLTWAALVLFFSALVTERWRFILVHRETLLLLRESGELDGVLLNSSIAVTRSQGVFAECFASSLVHIHNETDDIVKAECHPLLTRDQSGSSNPNHNMILGLIKMIMVLGPIVLAIAIPSVIIQIVAEYNDKLRTLLCLLNVIMRAGNSVVALIVLLFAVELGKAFQSDNPAYPESWPKMIRATTEVEIWELGPIEWILGMVCQAGALMFDLYHCTDSVPGSDHQELSSPIS